MDEPEWCKHLNKISDRQPFAVMYKKEDHFDRFEPHNYNPDRKDYSDTCILRDAIIAHMQKMVEDTHFEHYEKFRAQIKMDERSARGHDKNIFSVNDNSQVQKERIRI